MKDEYPISPIGYWKRHKQNVEEHNATQDRRFLFYAALEMRFTIEAILFEYLWAVSKKDLSKSEQKLYSAKTLKAAILSVDPLFQQKLDFVDMCSYYGDDFKRFVKPDLNMLSEVYGLLGAFLHVQKRANHGNRLSKEFWFDFATVLERPAQHIALVLSAPFITIEFTDEGLDLIRSYSSGELSQSDVRERLNKRWGICFKSVSESFHEI